MFSRFSFFLLGFTAISLGLAWGDNPRALPVASVPPVAPVPAKTAAPVTPRVAAPAFVQEVTFDVRFDAEAHRLVVVAAPNLTRIDEPLDRFSVIYDPATDHYTGLEHSNDTFWEFSWPAVRDAVQASKRGEARLRDLGSDGLEGYEQQAAAETNAPTGVDGSDTTGYVWHSTTDKKRIGGFDCVRWEGDTVAGETIDAWCTTQPMPAVQDALDRLRPMNEPLALVPVRVIVPPLVFTVYDAMAKGGVTPILITWGGDLDQNRFAFLGVKNRDGKLSQFEVPKYYRKTTLVTMDGMMGQPVAAPPISPSVTPSPGAGMPPPPGR